MKLLFLTSRFPWPLDKGDKLRAYEMIRHLSKYAEIYLFTLNETAPDESALEKLRPWCRAIAVSRISRSESMLSMLLVAGKRKLPFQLAWFRSKKAAVALREFCQQHRPDALYCHLIRMAPYADIPELNIKLIDYMDTFSTGMERLAKSGAWWMRLPAREEAYRLRRYENNSYQQFDRHIIISEQDQQRFPHPEKNKIDIVVNGVDFNYYKVSERAPRYDLLFLGHMSYPPNVDAVTYIASKIMPLIRQIRPGIRLLIAGAQPSRAVQKLACDDIEVSGWVEDTRTIMAESKILLAPMQLSIGLQNKILQAMACGLPCIVSPLANNAVQAVDGESILCADEPKSYAEAVIRLLDDQELYQKISEEGLQFVKAHFEWDAQACKVIQLLTN